MLALGLVTVTVRVLQGIEEVRPEAWDALLGPDATPFERWAFLDALESSGSASPQAGWVPRHLTLWRGPELIAAAPTWIRTAHDGADFARDWAIGELAARFGASWLPKLVTSIPITPVTGPRLLVRADERRDELVPRLVEAGRALARSLGIASHLVLFPRASEAAELATLGLTTRIDTQAHWVNHGQGTWEGWLASLDAKRRHAVRRETAAPARQGITIRTVRGEEIARDKLAWGQTVWRLFKATLDRMGWHWRTRLNEKFFVRLFDTMPGPLEVVEARREGQLIAGAWNVASATHLYGRYWGAFEEHPFLHFNVCLYHSIDDCLKRGLAVFEGGAGGEHKVLKGFDVAPTYTAIWAADPTLQQVLAGAIGRERAHREAELAAWTADAAAGRARRAGGGGTT